MIIRTLQILGVLCLVAAIALVGVAGGIEAARSAEDYDAGEGRVTSVARSERQTATIQRLVKTALPLFLVGSLTCGVAWSRHRAEHALRRPGARYFAAKLCLPAQSERRPRPRPRRRSRRSQGSSRLSIL